MVRSQVVRRKVCIGVNKGYLQGADKESINELEGKKVDKKFVHNRKRKDKRQA